MIKEKRPMAVTPMLTRALRKKLGLLLQEFEFIITIFVIGVKYKTEQPSLHNRLS